MPSASRPGQFSYLHVPTGYKQAEVPTTDAPPPAMLAANGAEAEAEAGALPLAEAESGADDAWVARALDRTPPPPPEDAPSLVHHSVTTHRSQTTSD